MSTRRFAIVVALVLASVGCKNPLSTSREVTYHVTGAGPADMTYASSDGATAQRSNQALPWSSFMSSASVGDFAYLSAQRGSGSGCITAEIKIDGKFFESATSCGAFVIASASGTVK